MAEPEVRPYLHADRPAVHCIAADTAFFGEPVEVFLDDRRLFLESFYDYYTDLEPEHSWVASAGAQVVGFLMGAVNTAAQQRKWRREILPAVTWRALRGRYRLGSLTRRYVFALARAALSGELVHADLSTYPAHLHINVAVRWRGRGLGRCLIQAYLAQLRQLAVPGVHLMTTSLNEAACRLYTGIGFQLLESRRTRTWAHLVDQEVENRCYGLRLQP